MNKQVKREGCGAAHCSFNKLMRCTLKHITVDDDTKCLSLLEKSNLPDDITFGTIIKCENEYCEYCLNGICQEKEIEIEIIYNETVCMNNTN